MQQPFSDEMMKFAPAAIARLAYIYPALQFSIDDSGVAVAGFTPGEEANLRREISYALYREKIDTESAPLKSRMFEALFGR